MPRPLSQEFVLSIQDPRYVHSNVKKITEEGARDEESRWSACDLAEALRLMFHRPYAVRYRDYGWDIYPSTEERDKSEIYRTKDVS